MPPWVPGGDDEAAPASDEQPVGPRIVGAPDTWAIGSAEEASKHIAALPTVFLDRSDALIWIDDRPGGNPLIRAVAPSMVPDLLGRAGVTVWKRKGRSSVPIDAPAVLCNTVVSRRSEAVEWRRFAGFASGPYLLPSGELVQRHGQHADSGLWLPHRGRCAVPSDGRGATRERGFESLSEGRAALDWILSELKEFPWADPALDPAAWLSYLLTLFLRAGPLLDKPVPLFLSEASRPRSGKDLLLKIAELLAYNRISRRVNLGADEEENKKALGTAIREGYTGIVFGDVKHLGSPLILSLITEGTAVSIRLLGASESIPVPATLILGATANNVTLPLPDLVPRTIYFRLDPPTPKPELTPHQRDQDELLDWYKMRRAPILAALTNVIRGYIHRTRDPETEVTGSPCGTFPTWARWVRDPLMYYGLPDVLDVQTRLARQTPVGDAGPLEAMFAAWWSVFRDGWVTPGQVIAAAAVVDVTRERDDGGFETVQDPARRALGEALSILFDGRISPRKLADKLASNRDWLGATSEARIKLVGDTRHNQRVFALTKLP